MNSPPSSTLSFQNWGADWPLAGLQRHANTEGTRWSIKQIALPTPPQKVKGNPTQETKPTIWLLTCLSPSNSTCAGRAFITFELFLDHTSPPRAAIERSEAEQQCSVQYTNICRNLNRRGSKLAAPIQSNPNVNAPPTSISFPAISCLKADRSPIPIQRQPLLRITPDDLAHPPRQHVYTTKTFTACASSRVAQRCNCRVLVAFEAFQASQEGKPPFSFASLCPASHLAASFHPRPLRLAPRYGLR